MSMQLEDVSFSYSGAAALRNVSLALEAGGSLVALTGPNGSGKSTLLKLMARVTAPSSGTVRYEQRPLEEWPAKEFAKRVAYLPQEIDTTFPMQAIDVVLSGRAPFLGRFAWETAADYREAERALEACDAGHLAERYLDEMSGGERKRVFLARALAGDPSLILLDEPMSALDVSHVQQIAALLRGIADRTGSTIVFASHDLNWAAAYSDRMLVMQEGRLALDASPSAVMNEETIRRYFAFDAQLTVSGGRTWVVPRIGPS